MNDLSPFRSPVITGSAAKPSEPWSARTERTRELRHHLGHLDALRGIAVLMVISVHTGIIFGNSLFALINNPGMRGVQLFFVVSAFTLLLSAQRRTTDRYPTLYFLLRRYFRLAPLCYVFIVVAWFTVPMYRNFGVVHTLPALLFLQNFSPTYYGVGANAGWSLGVEAIFYLCFPLLVRWIRTLQSAVVWLAGAAVCTTAIWHVMAHLRPDQLYYWNYYSFLVECPVFLLGFVCFFLYEQHLKPIIGKPEAKPLSAALLALTCLIFVAVIPIEASKTFFSSIFCPVLLLAVSLYPWSLLVNRVTIFLGKISYSMYLIHVALVTSVLPWAKLRLPDQARHHQLSWWLVSYVCTVLTSAALGTLTWLWIEEPGIRLGRRCIRWIEDRSTPRPDLTVPPIAVLGTTNSPDAQF